MGRSGFRNRLATGGRANDEHARPKLSGLPGRNVAAVTMTDSETIGVELLDRIRRLYPICRSITGDGVRETLGLIGEEIDLRTTEVPSGTSVLDWTVPREWNIRDAYIKNDRGERVVDFRESNLHVLNYSVPVKGRMSLAE